MNNKVNILDAWIMVEKLSEGSIDLKDYGMRTFDNQINDWERMLLDFLVKHKEKEKLSDRDFDKSGIALFFGIFDFEEVLRILRDKYKIPVSLYEERSNSKKFSFVIFLDNQLRFQSNKFSYTMSGYIRNHGDFPEDIKKEEDSLCDYFSGKFAEESFNAVLFRLFNECKVNLNNFRYKFVRNLEYDAINMHSFFIRDLEKAKNIDTGNLNRYYFTT